MNHLHPKRENRRSGFTLANSLQQDRNICVPYLLSNSFCPSNLGFFWACSSLLASCRSFSFGVPLVISDDVTLFPPFTRSPKHLYHFREPFQAPKSVAFKLPTTRPKVTRRATLNNTQCPTVITLNTLPKRANFTILSRCPAATTLAIFSVYVERLYYFVSEERKVQTKT